MEHDNSYFKFYLSFSSVSLRCLGHVEYFSAKIQVLFLWLFAKKDKNIKTLDERGWSLRKKPLLSRAFKICFGSTVGYLTLACVTLLI